MFHKSFCRGYNFSYSLGIYVQQMLDPTFTDIKYLSGWKNTPFSAWGLVFILAGHSYPSPCSGITRIYSELRPIQRFSAMAAALETGFPLHDAAMSSLVIGRAVAVWSDLCTRPQAPSVWSVWALESSICWRITHISRCGAIHRRHKKNRDLNG